MKGDLVIVRGPTNDYKMSREGYSSLCKKRVFLLPVVWFRNAEKAYFDPDVLSYVVCRGFTISSFFSFFFQVFIAFKENMHFVVSILA